MSIFTPKSAPEAGTKIAARQSTASPPARSSASGDALTGMGHYHYARSPLQRRAIDASATELTAQSQVPPMRSMYGASLPADLQAGIQALSGLSLDEVKVHYNSPKPAQLNARAYAQGNDIHLASGQEQHLPHEAWHVVQQREGRAHVTGQVGGQPLNDDIKLEQEADVMGGRAASTTARGYTAPRQRSLPVPSNPPVQGYFTDSARRKDIFSFENASAGDIESVRNYLLSEAPYLLEEFDAANAEKTSHGPLQAWLKNKGLPVLDLIRFPQTRHIPSSWIVSTTTPNDNGPPILLDPGYIDSPASSQEQDIALDEDPRDTDMVIDLTRDQLPYHRGGFIPVDDTTRSEVRASAMLTNEYVDYSPTPLIGRGTDPIRSQTDSLRKRARNHDKARSSGKTYSHHPDTFWTGQPYSAMGWHPVSKNTNTLDGDYQQLTSRGGQRLTGVVTKEKRGYMRPTLTAHNKSKARQDEVDALMEQIDGADLATLTTIHENAEEFAVTDKARNLWRALGDVLNTLPVVIADGEGAELAAQAEHYLAIEFYELPESTSTVAGLLYAIADALKELQIT